MRGLSASHAWTTTVTSELLLPGYHIDPESGAWQTLPWPTDPDERMAIVRRSLGPALIDWAEGRTDEPGLTHYLSGQPWTFTPGQKRFLILWYALSEDGRFDFRRGVKRGAKGTGKDPFAGSIADMELLDTAMIHARFWLGDARLAPELRLRTAKFGATPEDRQRLKIKFVDAFRVEQPTEVARLDDYRDL